MYIISFSSFTLISKPKLYFGHACRRQLGKLLGMSERTEWVNAWNDWKLGMSKLWNKWRQVEERKTSWQGWRHRTNMADTWPVERTYNTRQLVLAITRSHMTWRGTTSHHNLATFLQFQFVSWKTRRFGLMLFDNPHPGTDSSAHRLLWFCLVRVLWGGFAGGSIAEYFCDKNLKTESMLLDDVLSCSVVPAKIHTQHSLKFVV